MVEAPRREVMVSPEDWTCSGLNLNFLCLGPKKIICDQVHTLHRIFMSLFVKLKDESNKIAQTF